MAGVCMLYMSAAFDIVDHELLLQKFSMDLMKILFSG